MISKFKNLKEQLMLNIDKKLKAASLNSKFTGSYENSVLTLL